jgi:two-component system cell cycle response regulator
MPDRALHQSHASLTAQLGLAGGLVLLAAHSLLGLGDAGAFFNNWLYDGLMLGSAGLCLARVVMAKDEWAAWGLIGVALLLWALADIYSTSVLTGTGADPFPSPADAGYLAFYPLVLAGMALLVRARLPKVPAATWLDGAIAALAMSMIGIEVLLDVALRNTDASGLELVASVAYPLGDILTLSFAAAVLVVIRGVPGRSWALIVLGLALSAFADAVYSYQVYGGSYVPGSWVDLIWPAGAVAFAFAAWQPVQHQAATVARGFRAVVVPAAFTLLIAARFAISPAIPVNRLALLVAAATLVVIVARFVLTMAENQKLVRRIEIDPLTGLENRGKLLEDLRAVLAAREPRLLAIFDLDGFKAYNDTFGHPAGDALLDRLGSRLRESVRNGNAYRIGGDEFCVMLPGDCGAEAIERAALALSGQGEGFEVNASYGYVRLPDEAATPSAALQIADKRMYAYKDSHRLSAGGQAKAVLLRALRERQPDLGRHVSSVSALAAAVGNRLGVEASDLIVLARAAELHDIGKMAIPDAILDKPGPLSDEEWTFMKQHTILGERILSSAQALAPVAQIVRSSHEHFDGSGYPDGLAGDAIPLAGRVILACDAYEAMTSHRPYAPALSDGEARAELLRCSGTQFDPHVVEILLGVLNADQVPAIDTSLGVEAQTA